MRSDFYLAGLEGLADPPSCTLQNTPMPTVADGNPRRSLSLLSCV